MLPPLGGHPDHKPAGLAHPRAEAVVHKGFFAHHAPERLVETATVAATAWALEGSLTRRERVWALG